jgi:hypothetical protein
MRKDVALGGTKIIKRPRGLFDDRHRKTQLFCISLVSANLYSVSFNVALRAVVHQLRSNRRFKAKIYVVDAFTELVRIVDTVNRGRAYKPRFFVPGAPVSNSQRNGYGT